MQLIKKVLFLVSIMAVVPVLADVSTVILQNCGGLNVRSSSPAGWAPVVGAHTVFAFAVGNHDAGTSSAITTTGSTFLVACTDYFPGGTLSAFSDSKSNNWSALTLRSGALTGSRIFYSTSSVANPNAVAVGTNHTFTMSGGSLYASFAVSGWTGGNLTAPFDQQNGAVNASGTTLQPGSVTPTQNNELIITCFGNNAVGTYSINSGFTIIDQVSTVGGASFGVGAAYLVQGTAAAINPTWTNTGAADDESASIATFKAAP